MKKKTVENSIKMGSAFLLCAHSQPGLTNNAASGQLPEMQMHIFSESPTVAGFDIVEPDRDDSQMKMVIFTSDAQLPTQPELKRGENVRLNYADDQVRISPESPEIAMESDSAEDISIELHLDSGYRQDKLDWTIAHPSGEPNILSELSWDNIDIIGFEVGARIKTASHWVVEANVGYGGIIDGDNQDSDYFGNDRTLEFSRSNNNADEGDVVDASIAAGYQFDMGQWPDRTTVANLTPKVGFSYHSQNLKMKNGVQTISTPGITPPLGNFNAILDSSYDAEWYGPWAGIDGELNLNKFVRLWGNFEYHYAYYDAKANWNLRWDFQHPKSFTHEAEGNGIVAAAGSRFLLSDELYLNLSVNYKDWQADKEGIDTTYFASGHAGETKLNSVNWKSMGANIGVQYRF